MGKFETNLILEVELHDCLYNKNSADYRNRTKKAQTWKDISRVVGKSALECQKKWVNLRDTFFRLYKTQKNLPFGSTSVSNIKWKYFNSLQYLSESTKIASTIVDCKEEPEDVQSQSIIICENRKEVSYTDTNSDNKTECYYRVNVVDEIDPLNNLKEEHVLSQVQLTQPITSVEKRKEPSYTDTNSTNKKKCYQCLDAKTILPLNNLNEPHFPSPLQQFFGSIAIQGERLSRRKQLKLQMKCLKSLEEVELEDSD